MNNFMNMYQQFRQNSTNMLRQRFNIPQNVDMNNPNSIIEHLLNTNQISQAQVNNVMGMRNNPMIQQIMKH